MSNHPFRWGCPNLVHLVFMLNLRCMSGYSLKVGKLGWSLAWTHAYVQMHPFVLDMFVGLSSKHTSPWLDLLIMGPESHEKKEILWGQKIRHGNRPQAQEHGTSPVLVGWAGLTSLTLLMSADPIYGPKIYGSSVAWFKNLENLVVILMIRIVGCKD